ncbi:MAG: dienelactone hydrolase family protein [Alphaproteobacteria bacterium]|nr:dienelactone hydrolase family protein [Alphaproteobacteria bacterium]
MFRLHLAALAAVTLLATAARAGDVDLSEWPDHTAISVAGGTSVTYPSHSPFTLWEVGKSDELDPPTEARAALFLPDGASADRPAPAVVLLHGAAGVLSARELTYGAQFAEMGVAALVVDAFGARRDRASGFIDRLLNITETMVIADAYAGLRYLDSLPQVDGERVALMGFSYGGMSTMLAAFEQTAATLSPDGLRFAAHISFYGPCLARFDDKTATGAPVLLLAGAKDAIVDPERCNEVVEDLREGGAEAEFVVYEDAYHQWDGRFGGPRMIGRNLAPCAFNVNESGVVRDTFTFLPMSGPFLRKVILGACVESEGYLIGRDDAVRARSNDAVGAFLMKAFNGKEG